MNCTQCNALASQVVTQAQRIQRLEQVIKLQNEDIAQLRASQNEAEIVDLLTEWGFISVAMPTDAGIQFFVKQDKQATFIG